MGGLLSIFGGAPKMPALPKAPVAPDVTKVAQQSDLDRQRNAAAGASPSTTIAGGNTALTTDASVLKKTLSGF